VAVFWHECQENPNVPGTTGYAHAEEWNGPPSSHINEKKLRMDQRLQSENCRSLEEHIEVKLPWVKDRILRYDTKAQTI
jgi:hypothetical protein